MKKNLQIKNSLKVLFLAGFSCCLFLAGCKKSDATTIEPTEKSANFSADVNGTATAGTEFLEYSYITTNDEFLETPYAEIHIAGGNTMLDIMIANPTVKQYSFSGASSDAGVVFTLNGSIYEATNTSVLNVTEATATKISGVISGAFKNVNTGTNVQVNNGSFSAQF